jgi:hypothetical protein
VAHFAFGLTRISGGLDIKITKIRLVKITAVGLFTLVSICVIAFYSTFKLVPLVGMDTTNRYYVFRWSDQPVGIGPAIVTKDGKNYYFVQVGHPTMEIDRPQGRILDFLLYDRAGVNGSDWYTSRPTVLVSGNLRFEVGDYDWHEYLDYKVPR